MTGMYGLLKSSRLIEFEGETPAQGTGTGNVNVQP